MAAPDLFQLAQDADMARRHAERLFEAVSRELGSLLPASAEILHVGATAIPGCLTKGDLDVVVRVDRDDFEAAETRLASLLARNAGSAKTDEFAAFENATLSPNLGVQLTAKDGALDVFHLFANALRADPSLVRRYNALKRAHHDQPMTAYRAAKDAFVTEVLRQAGGLPDR